MSDSEEDAASISKQKSIFSGMGRVKQINHLREKWSPKPKQPLPDRSFADAAAASSAWRRPASAGKPPMEPLRESARSPRRAQSVSGNSKRQPVLSVMDLERYLAINTWLDHNGIDASQINVERDVGGSPKRRGLLDEMYSSLEMMETALENELANLEGSKAGTSADAMEKTAVPASDTSSPALFDYLAVIGADMIDVTIRNYWNHRENVFEATVAFAHPPESQFYAESLEHFCFPAGVKVVKLFARDGKEKRLSGGSLTSTEEDFFVLMLSGGGVQGQSVQYAMCMKGLVTLRDGNGGLTMPICYCIIARIPFIPFFKGVLQGLFDNLRSEFESSACSDFNSLSNIVTNKHAGYIDDILQTIKKIRLPDIGCTVFVDVFPHTSSEFTLTRPHEGNYADEKAALLLHWSLPSLLAHLSIDRVLQILGYMLVEMKVVVVSDEISLLSSTTLGLASLLHPLTWAGPLISVLPGFMHEYMEAPVPLICGVDELPHNFECSKGTCVLYPEENRVQLHPEDERLFSKVEMPGWTSLSGDLTRFTKEMQGRAGGSSRDKIVPLSIHLVIHRVRRHIEDLIRHCARATEQYQALDTEDRLDPRESRFIDGIMQSQMYQKYRDDQPPAALSELRIPQVLPIQTLKQNTPTTASLSPKKHDDLKEAASVLFQIALAGASLYPRTGSRLTVTTDAVACSDTPIQDVEPLPISDEPIELDLGMVRTPSSSTTTPIPTPTSTARSVFSANNSPKEKTDLPLKEPATAQDEASAYSERRRDRTYVWPIGQSGLDLSWLTEDSSQASPRSVLRASLHSQLTDKESPYRSTNNDGEFGGGDDMKSVGRSEHDSIAYPPRGDTETTISVFDVALSEVLGSAETDDLWMFEPPDEPFSYVQRDEDSDDERTSQHEGSGIEDNTSMHKEAPADHIMSTQDQSPCEYTLHSWRHGVDEKTDDLSESSEPLPNNRLAPEQAKTLMTGINVDSRGAWDGWCEGKLFMSSDCTTLTWERRAVAFAALNINVADITGFVIEDSRITVPGRHEERRIELHFGSEAIHFQFLASVHRDEFFRAMKLLFQPAQVHVIVHAIERKESFVSSPVPVAAPQLDDRRYTSLERLSESMPGDNVAVQTLPAQKETDINQFKARFQRGFLVEKHGRLGKPHAKLIYTDVLCSHIIWRKPPVAHSEDQQKLVDGDDHIHHRGLFSHNKSIPVESITAIVTGKQTSVFRRAAANKTNDRLCLSILTPTRTLDICAYSLHGFQELYRGLSLLLGEGNETCDELN